MNKIYEVWSIARSDGKRHSWGARKTQEEADQLLEDRFTGEHEEWAKKHHSRWWVDAISDF